MTDRSMPTRILTCLDQLLAETAAVHGDDPDSAGLLVALSGGPDSVATLALASGWALERGRPLLAAHFNHRLRGDEADRDEAFCRDLCARLDIPLECGAGDPRPVARQRGRGLEEAARHLRLDFLEGVRASHSLTAIATGHHADDQAETVVMRLFRGTGLDGLRGLRPRRDRLVRPLLHESRKDILDYLAHQSLTWREDATNFDGSNRRGRLRRELIPLVRDIFGEGAAVAPAHLADLLDTDLTYLEDQTSAAWAVLADDTLPGHSGPSLDARGVAVLPEALARRVIRRWLHDFLPVDLARSHVQDVLNWLRHSQSGTGLDLPGPLRLERVFDRIGIAGHPPILDDATAWRVMIEPLPEKPSPVPPAGRQGDSWQLVCSSDALQGNCRLRHPRPGDRMEPLGLGGSKKLSDMLQEKRVPANLRPGILVLEDDGGILWVVGLAQSERTRLLPSNRQAVTISLIQRRATAED